jgi:hypothetical protein
MILKSKSTLLLIVEKILLTRMNMNKIGMGTDEKVFNAIFTTALLANELCVQTQGQFIIPELDYIHYVQDFNYKMAKKIIPIKTHDDFKDEVKKYVSELIKASQETDNATGDPGTKEDLQDIL